MRESCQRNSWALHRVARLVGTPSCTLKGPGSILSQGTYLGAGLVPSWGEYERQSIDVSLSLSLSPSLFLSLSLNRNFFKKSINILR